MSHPSSDREARSGLWKHGLILALLIGFSTLLFGGFYVYRSAAPIPDRVVGPDGSVVTTAARIKGGQAVYQKYGLMDYGSVLGHGAYLGPDYTAETLHLTTLHMRDFYGLEKYGAAFASLGTDEQAAVADRVTRELKTNRYDPATGNLTLAPAQVYALGKVREHYQTVFTEGEADRALPAGTVQEAHLPAGSQLLLHQ